MTFWKNLFGGGQPASAPKASDPVEYNGFLIRAAPFKEGANYQTAGTIEKEIDGVRKEHRFIRADSHPVYDDAVSFTVSKGRQIIDQMGERLFD